jgi:hypothetical protein
VGFAIGQPPTFWSPGNAMVVNHLIPSEIIRFPGNYSPPCASPAPVGGGIAIGGVRLTGNTSISL